jgi:peptidoglycan/LPS O-acetylase OafA/YrhL
MTYASPRYRRDIDGLRAIAIISVVLFHAFPKLAPGGYVGVDVFFVISGFLITSNIVENLQRGTFSFAEFYIRRAKRIFPALTVVLLVTIGIGWFWLLPSEYVDLGKHAFAGAGFATNVVQWTEAGYFDPAAKLKPLLHLWSLGIEEQFYLAWPIVAWMAWRFRKRVFPVATVIVITSFAYQLCIASHDPVAAFYLPFPRAWELLLGASLATLPAFARIDTTIAREGAGIVGLALILRAVACFDAHSPYPGWRALLPTFGAALLLWAGPSAAPNRALLSNSTIVAVGLISYALYLWHWPLLSFLAIAHIDTPLANAAAVALAVILATASYFLVERPVRSASMRGWRLPVAGLVAAAVLGLAVFGNYIPAHVSMNSDFAMIEAAGKDWETIQGSPVLYQGNHFYRDGNGKRAFLLIGDSNMQQYFARIHALVVQDPCLTTIYLTTGGCAPIAGMDNDYHAFCRDYFSSVYEYAKNSTAGTVIIAAQWPYYFMYSGYWYEGTPVSTHPGYDKAIASLQRSMGDLERRGKKVYLVLPMPVGTDFGSQNWVKRTITGLHINPIEHLSRKDFPASYAQISKDLRAAAQVAGASTIDPYDLLCDPDFCRTAEDGIPIYMNDVHLRADFVRARVRYLDQIFEPTSGVSSVHATAH